ncbi:hypothetical protein [Xenorhabdus bovienii]|uniref:Uncharacterized protein n=1 Tax=Xenorhabdus bovienii str. feltiae Moldova TaxID=1398200 RepID=A0A077NE96_XENBV|nr:hypothetical protein [Xenorhabdus bovienii]CDH00537.1 hypothetical protein XBFM1_1710005 [Xenorhabdus bovienii str. feltiae Moldova]
MLEIVTDFTPSQLSDIAEYIKDKSTYCPIYIYPIWSMLNDCQAVRVANDSNEIIIFQNNMPVAIYILNDNRTAAKGFYSLGYKK